MSECSIKAQPKNGNFPCAVWTSSTRDDSYENLYVSNLAHYHYKMRGRTAARALLLAHYFRKRAVTNSDFSAYSKLCRSLDKEPGVQEVNWKRNLALSNEIQRSCNVSCGRSRWMIHNEQPHETVNFPATRPTAFEQTCPGRNLRYMKSVRNVPMTMCYFVMHRSLALENSDAVKRVEKWGKTHLSTHSNSMNDRKSSYKNDTWDCSTFDDSDRAKGYRGICACIIQNLRCTRLRVQTVWMILPQRP